MDDRRPEPTQDTWSQWLPDLDSPDATATSAPSASSAPVMQPPVPLPPPAGRVDPLPYAAAPIAEWVGPRSGQAPPPPTRLGWAILCTICCFTPFGIVAIIKSTQVNPKWALGDWDGARAASRSVKTWCLLAAAISPGASMLLFACSSVGHMTDSL